MGQQQVDSVTVETGFPTWSQGTDFIVDLADWLERAGRLGLRTSLVILTDVPLSRAALREFFIFATTKLGTDDFAGVLGNGDYAMCLVDATPGDAEIVAEMLRQAMLTHSHAIGAATYPEDGSSVGALLLAARMSALRESMQRAA
jgi:hypothetical protein